MNSPAFDPEAAAADLARLFAPESIAVVGASDDRTRIGGKPIRYLLEAGYAGRILPVNPGRDTVQDLPCHRSIAAVPRPVDAAILAVPAEAMEQAVAECAAHGVKLAIIFSAGFAETDDTGRARQQRIEAIAHEAGMRLLGPNCLGLFDAGRGFYGTFTQALDDGIARPGPIAIASQSGAYGAHVLVLCKLRGLGVRYWIATGNEADIDIGDSLLWLAHEPEAKVIVVYIEAVRDGRKFIAGLEAARRARKPVIVLKVGRSQAGANAAASHTGALSGEDAVIDAVLKQYGAYRATSTENLVDVAYACARGIFPGGRRIGLLTLSGGVGIQMADTADDLGLDVAPMPEPAQAQIRAMLSYAAPANPIDLTAQVVNDVTLVSKALDIVVQQGGYDSLLLFLSTMPTVPHLCKPLSTVLHDQQPAFRERLAVLSFVGADEARRQFESWGYLVFEDVDRALAAMAALTGFAESFDAASTALSFEPLPALPPGPFDEHAAKQALTAAGIPAIAERRVDTPAQAAAAAAAFGSRVALKIVSHDIAHKTEAGGVALGLAPGEVQRAAEAMQRRIAEQLPTARLDGFLVAPMAPKGVETILGVMRDPVFGPVVMFGLGGVFVEVFRDVAFRLAPFGEDEALRMIRQTKGFALLQGARGAPPADVPALARALSRLSHFAVQHAARIAEIDINPFVVLPHGHGGMALDALIVASADSTTQTH